jgi:hypothetical protein
MPAYPRPVRVSPGDDPVIVQYDPDMDLWCGTDGSRRGHREVEGWASCIPAEIPTGVFAAALAEWAAHWPPRSDNDIDESVYDRLAELSADELEKAAHAAGEMSRRAWNVRYDKIVQKVTTDE